jgi:hypothetical protein
VSYVTKPEIQLPADMETPSVSMGKLCIFHLNSKSALQRLVITQVVIHWAKQLVVSELQFVVRYML